MVLEKKILDVVIQDLAMISSGTMVLHVHSIFFLSTHQCLKVKGRPDAVGEC